MFKGRNPEAIIRAGMKMYEKGNYDYAVQFLSKVNLAGMKVPLRARAISYSRISHPRQAYADFKMFLGCTRGHIDLRDEVFVRCLIDANMYMCDYAHAARVLKLMIKNETHERYMIMFVECMYHMGFFYDAMLAIMNIPRYENSQRLMEWMQCCEDKIMNDTPVKLFGKKIDEKNEKSEKNVKEKKEAPSENTSNEMHDLLMSALKSK